MLILLVHMHARFTLSHSGFIVISFCFCIADEQSNTLQNRWRKNIDIFFYLNPSKQDAGLCLLECDKISGKADTVFREYTAFQQQKTRFSTGALCTGFNWVCFCIQNECISFFFANYIVLNFCLSIGD